jgi:hypothetical protein
VLPGFGTPNPCNDSLNVGAWRAMPAFASYRIIFLADSRRKKQPSAEIIHTGKVAVKNVSGTL